MKTELHPLIIGAGGVASYLLPILLRTFNVTGGAIYDKDILEERNLDRQLFSANHIGQNKAEALLEHLACESYLMAIPEWFDAGSMDHVNEYDVVICVADNHAARRGALEFADMCAIPCVIGGNEYFDSDAYYYDPHWIDDEKRDPRMRYPELLTSNEGNPMSCQGEALEVHPQLAMANARCASQIMHLLWAWLHVLPEAGKHADMVFPKIPWELSTSLTHQELKQGS